MKNVSKALVGTFPDSTPVYHIKSDLTLSPVIEKTEISGNEKSLIFPSIITRDNVAYHGVILKQALNRRSNTSRSVLIPLNNQYLNIGSKWLCRFI